jgi:tetratricopeptide (TPR) repeat protein
MMMEARFTPTVILLALEKSRTRNSSSVGAADFCGGASRLVGTKIGYSRPVNNRLGSGRSVVALVVAVALALGAARVSAATDPRELKAREDFAAGRFQDALDIFARLYAESLHPNYLRNIARCYQKLGQPERAIDSFRDYLQKAKDITPDEKKEIDGYIKEMEDLKRAKEASAQPAAPAPLPAAPAPASPAASGAGAVVVDNPSAEVSPAEKPLYAKWWFWTLIGTAAVAAGVGIAAAAGVFTKTQNAPCTPPTMCP